MPSPAITPSRQLSSLASTSRTRLGAGSITVAARTSVSAWIPAFRISASSASPASIPLRIARHSAGDRNAGRLKKLMNLQITPSGTRNDPFLLRIDSAVLDAVQRWANDDLRSLNAQIEFVLPGRAAPHRPALSPNDPQFPG